MTDQLQRHKMVAVKRGRTIIDAENIDDEEIQKEVLI